MAGRKEATPKAAAAHHYSALPAVSLLGRAAYRLLQSTLARRLSRVPDVDAVFFAVDDEVIHVYTVVPEFDARVYEELMRQERLIQKDWPGINFDFHTRAHQEREPVLAVPFGMHTEFVRQ